MAITVPAEPYAIGNTAHEQLVKLTLTRFEEQLARMHVQDRYILMGGMIAMGTFLGTWIFPLTTIASIGSACATTAWTKDRKQLAKEYNAALQDAVTIYQWAMCNQGNMYAKVRNPGLQALVFGLGPYLSDKTLKTWQDSDLGPMPEKKPASTGAWLLSGITSGLKSAGILGETALGAEALQRFQALTATGRMDSWEYRLYGETGGEDFWHSLRAMGTQAVTCVGQYFYQPK